MKIIAMQCAIARLLKAVAFVAQTEFEQDRLQFLKMGKGSGSQRLQLMAHFDLLYLRQHLKIKVRAQRDLVFTAGALNFMSGTHYLLLIPCVQKIC